MVAIAHKAKAFDLHFNLNRAIVLKWKTDHIMNALKIMCVKMKHLRFLDSVLPSVCTEQTDRCFRLDGHQIV